MIIYGSKAEIIASTIISDDCSNCGTANSVRMSVYLKYAHVFWIPFFPIKKLGITECSHCHQVLEHKAFTRNLKESYERLKLNTKTPVSNYTGLIILSLLIGWGIIGSKMDDTKNQELILKPQNGDVYEIRTEQRQYTLYKVDSIIGDTVVLRLSQYETNKITGLSKIKNKGDEAYGEVAYAVAKNELKSMLDKGEIIDIDRN
jgi:hypothetical protein